jgi:virulence-associated protein VagC
MKEISFSKPVRLPNDLALISRRVKELKEGDRLILRLATRWDADAVASWCAETGNIFIKKNSPASRGLLIEIERGKGFHGATLRDRLGFYLWGVRLHSAEFLYKLKGRYPIFFFNFISIGEALRGIKIMDKLGSGFRLVPSPKEVEGYCGFAVGFEDFKTCESTFEKLLSEGIGVEIIFKRGEGDFEILKGAWDF